MAKTVSEVIAEWQEIEAKRPGGSFPNLDPLFERMSAGEWHIGEKPLLDIIEILHKTIYSYHEEMGVLIRHLQGDEA